MKYKLPKILKKSVFNNSDGIAHLAALVIFGVLVLGSAVVIYVGRDGVSVRERLGPDNDSEINEDYDSDDGSDSDEDQDNDGDRGDDNEDDKYTSDGGSYYVLFNDDSIKGTTGDNQPVTMEIGISDAWAQTCNGLYGSWKGTSTLTSVLSTGAGNDARSGDGEISFSVTEGDGKLDAGKSNLTIKQMVNCPYCEDPYIELTGAIVGGSKVACP